MFETLGTVNLKIERLRQRLRLLEQQQHLSKPYPEYSQSLIQEDSKTRTQLYLLLQYREELLQQVTR
jgi:hypothetical protein